MKKLILTITLTISPILAQCDWNEDSQVDILDVVATVECIMTGCWDENTVTDWDGNIYSTVIIGEQEWMAENLKVTHYGNGDQIQTGYSDSQWASLFSGAYAVYNDDSDNGEIFGNLYNWYAVNDERGICPDDYHIPSDEEWMELEMSIGMSYDEAHNEGYRGSNEGSQIAGNAEFWYDGNLENNEDFGASFLLALPGGYRESNNGIYLNIGTNGTFWSSSSVLSNTAWHRKLTYDNTQVFRLGSYMRHGFSVRCVRD
jgi:uncharacterized protein (TIGR02145 family)